MADTLPPRDTAHRRNVGVWWSMWDRPVNADTYSPNYTRMIANLVAGLMQGQPPTASVDVDVDLDELVEDVTRLAAATGLAVLRPAHDGERFGLQAIGPDRCEVSWSNKRMTRAVIWSLFTLSHAEADKDKRFAIIETWDPNPTYEAAIVERGDKAWNVKQRWPIDDVPATHAERPEVAGAREDASRLAGSKVSAFVWAWHGGYPAPVYVTNERMITGLERLNDQEQTDGEMARHRIAVDEKALGTAIVKDETGAIIARSGFQAESNVFLMKSTGGAAQAGQAAPVTPISFKDSTVGGERIDRRVNALLEAVGINPQSVGRSVHGRSDSAAAKRADQQMTMQTVKAPGRRLARVLSEALTETNRLNGTTGRVEVTVTPGLQPILAESAETAGALQAANAASTRTLIRTAHPDWSDDQVEAEFAAMAAEGLTVFPNE